MYIPNEEILAHVFNQIDLFLSYAGGELMKYIYKKHKLDENETRKFMRQIVSAIDHLHKAGIIHRYMPTDDYSGKYLTL